MTAGVALALAAVVSACGGLATESAVQQGSQVGESAVQPVRVQPDGPTSGGTPEQIVRGFLRAGAGAGFDDDHAIARSFFTPNVKDDWLPNSGVEVYGDDSALKVELLTPSTVRVSAPIVAKVDGDGRYHQTPAGTSARAIFGLQKLDVGWRISILQKGFGLWLSATDLDRIYRPFTIAYVSTSARIIVGDRRWFPNNPALATTLAREQLSAPPRYLVGAVQTGVPGGTVLAVDAVPVESGRALVDLSASAMSADPAQRRAMWAQFVTSLTQVPSVGEVSLTVERAPLDLPDTPNRVSALTTLGYGIDSAAPAKSAVLRVGSDLSRVSPDRPQDVDLSRKPSKPSTGSVLPKIATGWISLAMSWTGQEIAGIGGDHADLARWQGGRMFKLPQFGSSLTKPSYDSVDGLWVAGQSGGVAKLWVIDTSLSSMKDAKPREIPVSWLAKRTVLALRVASDNQRVALITSNPSGGDVRVEVAGIIRSANGAATSLSTEPLRVGWPLTAATDLAWVDGSTLAVVGRVGPKVAFGPHLVEIGGKVTALSPVAGSRLVTSTGGVRGVVVLTDRDKVLARAGNSWQQLQTGTDFLIPGG